MEWAMTIVPIKRPRELVYETVKRRIMMNELKPGSSLTELGLAREIGCSQGTIRAAPLRLPEAGPGHRAGRRGAAGAPAGAPRAGAEPGGSPSAPGGRPCDKGRPPGHHGDAP